MNAAPKPTVAKKIAQAISSFRSELTQLVRDQRKPIGKPVFPDSGTTLFTGDESTIQQDSLLTIQAGADKLKAIKTRIELNPSILKSISPAIPTANPVPSNNNTSDQAIGTVQDFKDQFFAIPNEDMINKIEKDPSTFIVINTSIGPLVLCNRQEINIGNSHKVVYIPVMIAKLPRIF